MKADVIGQKKKKKTVCRCARASFSPEILQAEAVKGLKEIRLKASARGRDG